MSDFGPRMAALTEKQRAFVEHFVATGGSNQSKSAIAAGYASPRVTGSKMAHDPRIVGAIKELSEAALGVDAPAAHVALRQMVLDASHKDHFAAVKLVLGINGFSPTNKTEIVHSIDTASLAEQITLLEAQLPADMRRRLNGPEDDP